MHELNLILITVNGEKKIITDMLWVFPYKLKIISMTHYLEIDVSFKACKPFKYCIYHWIIFNVSIPLALSIEDIYDMLFIRCKKHGLKTENFEGKEVLSDVGTAIKAFCQIHNMEKNYCHYHILNAFGARSCFSIWTSRLLK